MKVLPDFDSFSISLALEFRIKGYAFFPDADFDVITNSNDSVLITELAVVRDFQVWEKFLEYFLRWDNIDLMIGSKKRAQLMFSVSIKCWVRLHLWVTVVCLVIICNSLASSTESDITH